MYLDAEDCASAKEGNVFRYARADFRRDSDQRCDLRLRTSRRPDARLPIDVRTEARARICKRRDRKRRGRGFRESCASPAVIRRCESLVRSAEKRIRGGGGAKRGGGGGPPL